MPPKKQIPKTVNSLEEMTRKNQQHKSIQDDNLRIQGSTPKMKTSNAKQESTIQKQQDQKKQYTKSTSENGQE